MPEKSQKKKLVFQFCGPHQSKFWKCFEIPEAPQTEVNDGKSGKCPFGDQKCIFQGSSLEPRKWVFRPYGAPGGLGTRQLFKEVRVLKVVDFDRKGYGYLTFWPTIAVFLVLPFGPPSRGPNNIRSGKTDPVQFKGRLKQGPFGL